MNELKEAFFSSKTNKYPGYDHTNFNVVKKYFRQINKFLEHLFNLSLENGIFPEKIKIAKVIPLFKNVDLENFTKYHPISVLPCFFKMLKRIMYNQLYKYLRKEGVCYTQKSLGSKKFILQTMLSPILLIKSTSPLKMINTHSKYL